jgi:small subunit ribosomal protein S10
MVRKARIRLTSTDYHKLEEVCDELKAIANKTGAKMNGPVPLPTKRLKVPLRERLEDKKTCNYKQKGADSER